jgi:hypothetical protein
MAGDGTLIPRAAKKAPSDKLKPLIVQVVPAISTLIAAVVSRLLLPNNPGIALAVAVAPSTMVASSSTSATEQPSSTLPTVPSPIGSACARHEERSR